jgi:exopolysaccharide biosynthesis polyprenyl glycosylphosphotransferase
MRNRLTDSDLVEGGIRSSAEERWRRKSMSDHPLAAAPRADQVEPPRLGRPEPEVAEPAGHEPTAQVAERRVPHVPARDQRGYRVRRLLAVADAIAIVAAIGLAVILGSITGKAVAPNEPLTLAPVAIVLWLFLGGSILGTFHVDERRIDCSAADELGRIAQGIAVLMWGLFLAQSLWLEGPQPVGPAIVIWGLSVPLILLARHAARRMAQRRPWYVQSALIVGTAADVWRVRTMLIRHPEYGIEVAGTLEMPSAGDTDRVLALIREVESTEADRVIFASNYEGLDERTGALRFLAERGVKVDLVPGDSEVFRSDAELHFVEGLPFLTLPTTSRPRSAAFVKRAIDIIGAALALVLLAPLLAYCAIRIRLDSPGPVIFKQPRTGRRGRQFALFKFRTMVVEAEQRKHALFERGLHHDGMFKLADDPRITRFGASLRRSSIDELPQLINVLRGDMSLVGPRPLIGDESDLIHDPYRARFSVRPGITGPWQVLGRSDIPLQEMLKLDYMYVTNWSIGDDVKLLLRTMGAIVRKHGAY